MDARLNSLEYFKARLDAGDENEMLAQSGYMTRIRHDFVVKNIPQDSYLLDYGCGTGILLDHPNLPELRWYTGVDFIESRGEPVLSRMRSRGVLGGFVTVNAEGLTPKYEPVIQKLMRDHNPTTVVLCGVFGAEGFMDLHSIAEAFMYGGPRRLIATIPMQYGDHPDAEWGRFTQADLKGIPHVEHLYEGLVGAVW